MTKIVDTQYWLAELDVHGNPTLTDGAHDDTDGANEALYLYKRLGFYKEDVRYAIAKIEIMDVEDKAFKINEDAAESCKEMLDLYKRS